MTAPSPNFAYLAQHDPLLVQLPSLAERYFAEDPNTALIKLRQFAELLAQRVAAYVGIFQGPEESFVDLLSRLSARGALPPQVRDAFHSVRKAGNAASHAHGGTHGEAIHQLKMARGLGVWYHRLREPKFSPGPFVPPPDPKKMARDVQTEIEQLRKVLEEAERARGEALTAAQAEARRREEAEAEARRVVEDAKLWEALAAESDAALAQQRERADALLRELQERTKQAPSTEVQERIETAYREGQDLDLDEAATRKLIDQRLRDAGWEADTDTITFKKGVRPQKNRDVAIAEWPTKSGPADYVLFCGLEVYGVVEAKRKNRDVSAAIEQAKRYSRDYIVQDHEVFPGGPWREYQVPFLFSANGREYLRQLETKSGIWFQDVRGAENHARALDGWYSPDGLRGLLRIDTAAADGALSGSDPDYSWLREYQKRAIKRAEQAIAEGRRTILLAMATGTGKTRTCIALAYRLIKTGRFRRILFLVDRTALGTQTDDALGEVKLEQLKTFKEIYDVKALKDLRPEKDTRFHIATIQGMIRRVLDLEGEDGGEDSDATVPPVDWYDCIIVDEAHRGYNLDREMSDTELSFRSQEDYVSKYRRVLEHFDAVKVALTATPALHTTEIFGAPVYEYGYRQAVIDGWLIDHEPPVRIVTQLAEDGITWNAGEEVQVLDTRTAQIDTVVTPDEVSVEIEDFNRKVVTESFNRAVCHVLAEHVDPTLDGKTLIYCVTDSHADLVVKVLKEAMDARYGGIDDEAIVKITAASDRPDELLRRYKNERYPSVAVTVDLLTTGIDVPAISYLVFLRRVRSRILYEQMLGRATRRCDKIGKETFKIFDAVDLYAALEPYTSMKPVVTNPRITFEQLVRELREVTDEQARTIIKEQLVARLHRRARDLKGSTLTDFQERTGHSPEAFADFIRKETPEAVAAWFQQHAYLPVFLDGLRRDPAKMIVSLHEDVVRRVERGYGSSSKPEDYLESFGKFIRDNLNEIPALLVVTQRPRELTRRELKELKLALDQAGYSEASLRTAYRDVTNQDIAASIIGFVRQKALGDPLEPYPDRVERAVRRILASHSWNPSQRKWLERIGKQMKADTLVDRQALDEAQFKAEGGYNHLNKVFEGRIEEILKELNAALWAESA